MARISNNNAKWVGYIGWGIALFGLVFTVIGVYQLIGSMRFVSGAEKAKGEVIELVWRTDNDGDRVAAPLVAFTVEGQRYLFTSKTASKPPSYDVGETVDVLYRPDAPSDARIDTFWQIYGSSLLFSGIGLIFALVGLKMIRWRP